METWTTLTAFGFDVLLGVPGRARSVPRAGWLEFQSVAEVAEKQLGRTVKNADKSISEVPACGSSAVRSLGRDWRARRMRIGVLCTDAGVYVEVANFAAADAAVFREYVAAWDEAPGVFRFRCDVDLFYSDIEQTLSMSQAAAERALARMA